MKIIYNNLIPFKGYFAINIFGCMFIRNENKHVKVPQMTITHETIHSEQMLDFVFGCKWLKILGGIIFYILYFIEWLIKCLIFAFTFGKIKPYTSISFEQEAYNNDNKKYYPDTRKRFAWIKYIFKLSWK